jgi:small subunit ribosomal protein S24e
MQVTITQQQYNPLLKRKEVVFTINHSQTRGTPTRLEVRNALADMLKTKTEVVYVKSIKTKAGTMIATGEANAYDSLEQAQHIEEKYIIERNQPKEKKEAAEKAEAPPAPAEKPEQKTEQTAQKEG